VPFYVTLRTFAVMVPNMARSIADPRGGQAIRRWPSATLPTGPPAP